MKIITNVFQVNTHTPPHPHTHPIKCPLLKPDPRKRSQNVHAEAQGAGHVGLPVGAVEHEHAGEAAEEHPVWVGAQLDCYTGTQHYKDWTEGGEKR